MSDPSLETTQEAGGTLALRIGGDVTLRGARLEAAPALASLAQDGVRRVRIVDAGIGQWDSALLVFVRRVLEECERRGIEVERDALPEGVAKLLRLAEAVPARGGGGDTGRRSFVTRIGERAIAAVGAAGQFVEFVGEIVIALARLVRGRPGFRGQDLLYLLQQCGAEALPIVTLISVIIGMILAFVGALQLRQFGAGIYVADLVAIAMSREMACLMTGIIVAGRTGAAFAAQLGTMKVTEEIDALTTFGFAPLQFLVLPRVLALALMMPLLCLYSDLVGLLGGGVVGMSLLDLSPRTYVQSTLHALTITNVSLGVGKSLVFGALIGLFGCLRGIRCGSSASAVGDAATSAVVSGIVSIVVADGIFAVVTSLLEV